MKEDMKKNILSCITNLIIKVTYAKFVRYFIESQVQNLVEIRNAMNSLTNLKIKDQFEKIDGPTNREKIDGPTNREKK